MPFLQVSRLQKINGYHFVQDEDLTPLSKCGHLHLLSLQVSILEQAIGSHLNRDAHLSPSGSYGRLLLLFVKEFPLWFFQGED